RLMYLPFLILIPGIISLSTLTLVAAFNAGQGRVGVNLRGGLFSLLVIITGNVIFSERFGIYAAAAVSSIGYLSYQAYVMHQLKKYTKNIKLEDFFVPRISDLSFVKEVLSDRRV
ncbi:MAG TPA: polysaccharide biosynthesis C-terminal domain-containing protein, partial [Flavitalea sp.]|nr:polysaccharide biosynthesis C-terminal domain-containing protein [Flavitalea sp.]